jgi:two-component system, NarL family, sensor histidine kinase DevS
MTPYFPQYTSSWRNRHWEKLEAEARYCALSILIEAEGVKPRFATSGFAPQVVSTKTFPQGPPDPLLKALDEVPESEFPSTHPTIGSCLAVPILAQPGMIGGIFVMDKAGEESRKFCAEDREILARFSAQAAIAIENIQRYHHTEEIAIEKERERISRDLHDGIVQSIYAVGLLLEDGQHCVDSEPETARMRIQQAMQALNNVIVDIRSYILGLGPQRLHVEDLQQGLEALICRLRADSFLNVQAEIEPIEVGLLSGGEIYEIVHIAQEALTNIHRHALATEVYIQLRCHANQMNLSIEDNGVGFDLADVTDAGGLHNMEQRATLLNGRVEFKSVKGQGTCVRLMIPIGKKNASRRLEDS